MKLFLKIIPPFFLVFLIVRPVLADLPEGVTPPVDQASPPARFSPESFRQEQLEDLRSRLQQRLGEIRQQIGELRATSGARLSEAKKARARAFFALLVKRMRAAVNREGILITRIQTRLEKIEATNVNKEIDTAAIWTDLNEANGRLIQAGEALAEVESSFEDVLSANDSKTAFIEVKDLVKGIKQQLVEIHRLLVKIIGEIKGLRVGQGE